MRCTPLTVAVLSLFVGICTGAASQPEAAQTPPEAADSQPEAADTQPEADETQPEAAEIQPEEVRLRPIGYQHLAVLGNLVWELREYRDNEFLYEERLEEIHRYADAVDGRDVIWDVAVMRVDKSDVYVEVPSAARTRVVVASGQTEQALTMALSSHGSGDFVTPSRYLDYFKPQSISRYRAYYGPPSTMRYNLLAAPTALRIGEAIALEDAKHLRSRDFLRVTGRVEQVIMEVPTGFHDNVIVVIKDIKVLQFNPPPVNP